MTLPGIAGVEEEGVDEDLALGVTDLDAGRGGEAGEEVGKGSDVAIRSEAALGARVCLADRRVDLVGYAGAVEGEGTGGVAVVELIELSLAVLAAEAHLVRALDPGELVGEVAG